MAVSLTIEQIRARESETGDDYTCVPTWQVRDFIYESGATINDLVGGGASREQARHIIKLRTKCVPLYAADVICNAVGINLSLAGLTVIPSSREGAILMARDEVRSYSPDALLEFDIAAESRTEAERSMAPDEVDAEAKRLTREFIDECHVEGVEVITEADIRDRAGALMHLRRLMMDEHATRKVETATQQLSVVA